MGGKGWGGERVRVRPKRGVETHFWGVETHCVGWCATDDDSQGKLAAFVLLPNSLMYSKTNHRESIRQGIFFTDQEPKRPMTIRYRRSLYRRHC